MVPATETTATRMRAIIEIIMFLCNFGPRYVLAYISSIYPYMHIGIDFMEAHAHQQQAKDSLQSLA